MARTSYRRSSPYFETAQTSFYLDVLVDREILKQDTDQTKIIETKFDQRPDLFSQELYGTPDFWWVFARRNMELIKDPVFDFRAGLEIRVPSADFITNLRD